MRYIEIPGKKRITLNIWDTEGKEKNNTLNENIYKNVKAVILVYDTTNPQSFSELKNYWFKQVEQHCDRDLIKAIVTNKCDLCLYDEIYDFESEDFAQRKGDFFSYTSAKNDSGITYLFEKIAMKILDPDFDLTDMLRTGLERIENRKVKKNGITNNKKDNSKN